MDSSSLEALVTQYIRTNGNGDITGAKLQEVLLAMIAGARTVDLGVFSGSEAMEAAVKSEAVRVPDGATAGVPENETIYAAYSSETDGALRKYTFRTMTTETGTYLYRTMPSTGVVDMSSTTDGGSTWSAWATVSGDTEECAVLDLGSAFADVDAFTEALGTEAVIRSGKSIVTGKRVTEDGEESLFLCLQSINVISGTGRQYVFSNNNDGTSAMCGWRVRSINGVKSGSYTFGSWERTLPHKFWLNSNRYIEVGDYAEGGSGTGTIATVDLYNIFSAFSASRTSTTYTVTSTVAGRSRTATLAVATSSYAGLMSAEDKEKLDNLTELPVEAVFDAGTGIGQELTADEFDPEVSTELTDVRIQYCGGVVSGATTVGGHRFFLVGTDASGKTVARSTWADNAVAGRPGSWAYNADSDAMGTARLGVLFKLDGTTTRYYVDAVDTTTLTAFTLPTSGSSGGSSGGALTNFSISQSAVRATLSITVGDNTLTAQLPGATTSQAGLMRASDYTNLNNVVEKAAELEEEITGIKEDMSVVLPAVVSFDGVNPGESTNLSNPGMDGETELPVFFDTFEEADNYGGYNKLFTPLGVYWCSNVKEPDTSGTLYGQHRFFLIGTRIVPLTAGGSVTQTVAVKAWEDGDVSGYLGSYAYNEDDDANGYARKGVLFKDTDGGGLYYRDYDDTFRALTL